MAFAIDRHLFDVAVFRALSPLSTGEDEQDLHQRLLDYYAILVQAIPALHQAVAFRMELRNGGALLDDLVRLRLRDRILEWLAGHPAYGEFVIEGLFAVYRASRDHAGLIEAAGRIEMLGDLGAAALDLGEAWFWYGFEIDPACDAPLARYALHEAIARFNKCGAAVHLDAMAVALNRKERFRAA